MPAQQQYDPAMELSRAGDYAGAEGGCSCSWSKPTHPLTPNAAYWLAETYYVRKNYAANAAAFARNYQTYGKTAAKAPTTCLKLGMSLDGPGWRRTRPGLSYTELAKDPERSRPHPAGAGLRADRAQCV